MGSTPASASRGVYIAADFARAPEAESLASECRAVGVTVVSTWHTSVAAVEAANANTVGGPPAEAGRAAARRNIRELRLADIVVVLTTGQMARGGRHFETGYAHAMNKRILLVGVVEHAFHHLEGIRVAADTAAALSLVRSWTTENRAADD